MKRAADRVVKKFMSSRGYSPYYAGLLLKALKDDFFYNKNTTFKQKLWAYKRGFLSSKINMYGLNRENYKKYLSDFYYYQIQPVNGKFSKWIDDKLTIKYLLNSFDEYLPGYYYHITSSSKGPEVTRLMDCPSEFGEGFLDMLGLLQRKGELAAKLVAGSSGIGFYKLQYSHNQYCVNEQQRDQNEMLAFLQTLDGYILTEYLSCHKDLSRIWDKTANSIRIIMINKERTNPEVVGSWIKFGTDKTGPVDNFSAGGVVAHVDCSNGNFSNGMIWLNYKWLKCRVHPDSGVLVEGTIPFWDDIMQTLLSVCKHLPQLKLMGFDVVVTDNGFKIIEINSKPDIDIHNYYELQNTNDMLRNFFADINSNKRNQAITDGRGD